MYSDAEMEDVLFPHMMTDEELDEQFDVEPHSQNPMDDVLADSDTLNMTDWVMLLDYSEGDDW